MGVSEQMGVSVQIRASAQMAVSEWMKVSVQMGVSEHINGILIRDETLRTLTIYLERVGPGSQA